MPENNRINSIDIMRGLTLVLMLFVNDLFKPGVPLWLGNRPADFDGMGLADWVFPGFLFIAGMAIPFSISKRVSDGESLTEISKHIFKRFISLIIIGVLMLNIKRVNSELTGFNQNLWAILIFLGVFLIWNDYYDKENRFFTVTGFKLLGLSILVFLVFKFKSGQPDNNGSLIIGWWGILGLVGWGYLVSSFTYLFCRDSLFKTALITVVFLALNIISGLNLIILPDLLKTVFGVIISGNVPFTVLSGLLAGLIIRKLPVTEYRKIILVFILLGAFYIICGFVLRNWFIISKIKTTPSWGMICCGISMLFFILIYVIADIKKLTGWARFVRPAGENSLTTYLATGIIYYLIWSSGIPILIYKHSTNSLIVVAGSLLWAMVMVWLTALLLRLRIRLRL
jgi:heparan-alpha-glucosaminide N-acetyltransferase